MECKFCRRVIKNKGSLSAHEMSCVKNPERVNHKHSKDAGLKKGIIPWNKGIVLGVNPYFRDKYPDKEVFAENSKYPRHCLKRRILQDSLIKYECACCSIGPVWQGKPMILILDHINGINNDNRLENLRFVCSNCDSQLTTYKSKNRNRKSKPIGDGTCLESSRALIAP